MKPNESAASNLGPRLLGRKYVPDVRDWDLDKLTQHLAAFDDSTADKTIRELHDSGQLSSWSGILLLWRWIKSFFSKPVPPPSPGGSMWNDPVVLDQGNYGTCVGNGWAGWGDSMPVADTYDETDARAIYLEATIIDGAPDYSYQNGSTVRSGAKAMQNRRRLAAYAFGTVSQAIAWLSTHGPVVVGSDWTEGMFSPNPEGFIAPTGKVAGGHCYLMLGYDPTTEVFEFRNSWGTGWGLHGDFRMKHADFAALLGFQGELCFAAELLA